MLQCMIIVKWVFKEKLSCKAVSPLFSNLIHLHGYQLEYHPRDQYSEHPPPHLISRNIRNHPLYSLGWQVFAQCEPHNIFHQW